MTERPDTSPARSHVEHNRHKQRREAYWARTERIRDAITKCSRALEQGEKRHYYYIARQLHEMLVPLLVEQPDTGLRAHGEELFDHDDWAYVPTATFIDAPERHLAVLHPETVPGNLPQDVPEESVARQTVVAAFQTLSAIAEQREIIREELRSRVDATVFGEKIGEHLQDPEMDLGDTVEAISLLSGSVKTLHSGGTGQGKSTGLETEAEAYLREALQEGGRSYKLIDLVGFRDGENWFYDIPQRDETLRKKRESHGLPPSFLEDDNLDAADYPEVEILVPLTPGLDRQELPFDVAAERFTVRPFTVPAAEIRKRLLVSIMATKLTPEQENIVRSVYNSVNDSRPDWTLADLADEVRMRDELSDSKAQPVIKSLQQLQQKGFIRTSDSEHTLDWRSIFEETDTVTVFSQAFMSDDVAKLVAFGYVAEAIVQHREQMLGVPECVILMRELWKVAPHNRRQSFDARAAALQEAIGHMLAELFRENRHSGIHVLADTQQPSDLLKPVREMFNRYVVYNTNRDTVQDIFEWTANDKWRSFYHTLTPKPGEASVVGMVQPAIDERDIEFVGPIEYAAPSHHHRMEGTDATGWHARARYLDGEDGLADEELVRPVDSDVDWLDDVDVPTRLAIEDVEQEDGRPDIDYNPVAAFAERCLAHQPGTATKRVDVYTAFNAFMRDHERETRDFSEQSVTNTFGKRLSDALDYHDQLGESKREGKNAWTNLKLTTVGERYLEAPIETNSEGESATSD